MQLITNFSPPVSLARVREPLRDPLRIGLVQHAWRSDVAELT